MISNLKFLVFFVFAIAISSLQAQVPGCTDPLASNYEAGATVNNGSCVYGTANVTASSSVELPEIIEETSGIVFWNDKLWTHNDDADKNLYSFSADNVDNYTTIELAGTVNNDWEEISQDNDYIYIGDFGNNVSGNRTNLKILRVSKISILENDPIIDTINFVYSNQTDFTATAANETDFDCESFIVSTDSIYLFTKQWVSESTSLYSLSKTPGNHIANYKATLEVSGLITGAVYLRSKRLIVLSGYSSLVQPFIYLLYDFSGSDFFSGNKRKLGFSASFNQVEGITTVDGLLYFLTNEKLSQSFLTWENKLHTVDLNSYLGTYLGGLTVDITSPVISSTHDDVVFYADENCTTEVPDYRLDVIASDDLTPNTSLIVIQNPLPGTLVSLETTEIVLRVYDEADNFDEISFNVSILDTISPIVIGESNLVMEASETCSYTIPNYSGLLEINDNCTAFNNLDISQNPLPGTDIIGEINEISVLVTDEEGNSTEFVFNVEVIDGLNPELTCPVVSQILIGPGETSYTVSGTEFDPVEYFDNCEIVSVLNNLNNLSSLGSVELHTGVSTVVWIVTDAAGNTATCNLDIDVHSTDIATINKNGISVFPNPVNSLMYVRGENLDDVKFSLTDINGKQVSIMTNKSTGELIFDLSEYPEGIYFLHLNYVNEIFIYKILKE